MRLSQSDLADYLGVAQATLSQATSNGHKCKGYPVRAWAVYDGAGRVAGYDVPTHVMQRATDTEGTADAADAVVAAAPLLDPAAHQLRPNPSPAPTDASTNVSLLPKGQDYFRPVGAGGAAYVMGKAVEEDNGTARGAVMIAGVVIGGLAGWEVGDRQPLAGLLGALMGGAAGWIGFQSATRAQVQAGSAAEPGGVGGHEPPSLPRQRVQADDPAPLRTIAHR
jgi:hypothetical protein